MYALVQYCNEFRKQGIKQDSKDHVDENVKIAYKKLKVTVLYTEILTSYTCRANFFTVRTINSWSNLPESAVECLFKNFIDKYWTNKQYVIV